MTDLTPAEEEMLDLAKIGDIHGIRNALRQGADINASAPGLDAEGGETALMIAARNGYASVVAILCQTPGICINQRDDAGQTALHHAVFYDGTPATPALEIAGILLDAGADDTIEDEFHHTPLMVAAQLRSYDLAVYLVRRGCNPVRTNIRMETALALCGDRHVLETMRAIAASLPPGAPRTEREKAWLERELARNRKSIARLVQKGPSL